MLNNLFNLSNLLNFGKYLLLFAFLSANLFAENGNTFLWEVKPKNQPNKTLYLLGSIHVGTEDMYPLNPIIMDAWNKSDVLGVEVDIENIDFTEFIEDFFPKIMDFSTPLHEKLPADVYEKLKERFKTFGMPLLNEGGLDYLTPLGAALILNMLDSKIMDLVKAMQENETNPLAKGIDLYFLELARQEDKEIIEVESAERQIQALEELNDFIVDYIRALLERQNAEIKESDITDMFIAWKNGDVEKIEKLMIEPFSSDKNVDAKINDALLYKRNQEMAEKIEQYILEDEKYFIVIGAGHFIGEKSVLDFLNQTKKYNIRRL